MNWRTKLPGARISETHASAIVVTRATTKAGSVEAHSASARTNSTSTGCPPASPSGVSTTATKTASVEATTAPAVAASAPAVASRPTCVSESERGDTY
jgi:hypothetical protein